jgi:hypothetical protein
MTHLTATIAATAPGPMSVIGRTLQIAGVSRLAAEATKSNSYSLVANFLELACASSHYSVTGAHALSTLACRLGDSHISHEVSASPNTRGDAADGQARAGDG